MENVQNMSNGFTSLKLLHVSRNADQHPAFFAVYNMETTEIVAFYQVTSVAVSYILYPKFRD